MLSEIKPTSNINAKTKGTVVPKCPKLKSFLYRIFNVAKHTPNMNTRYFYNIYINRHSNLIDVEDFTTIVLNNLDYVSNNLPTLRTHKTENINNQIHLQVYIKIDVIDKANDLKTKIMYLLVNDLNIYNIEFVNYEKDINLQREYNTFSFESDPLTKDEVYLDILLEPLYKENEKRIAEKEDYYFQDIVELYKKEMEMLILIGQEPFDDWTYTEIQAWAAEMLKKIKIQYAIHKPETEYMKTLGDAELKSYIHKWNTEWSLHIIKESLKKYNYRNDITNK